MNKLPYNIDDLRKICSYENILLTKHSRKRCMERNITLDNIMTAIMTGEIIEEYPDGAPFASCLICGHDIHNLYLHVVLSSDMMRIHIITAYYPDDDEWNEDMKTRK